MSVSASPVISCPQCRFEQPAGEETCRKCGVIFSKYRSVTLPRHRTRGAGSQSFRWLPVAQQWLIETDESDDPLTLVGRSLVFMLLVWWGAKFIVTPLETNFTGESFLHLINLPFHEAGHVLFMLFGRFMMFLGGSLGQVLMPIVCLITFLIKTRDPFGASVALWWTGENFMDLAPYINDARALDLMLLGGVTGKETDGHDWENILGMLGWLQYDHHLAHLSYNLGVALMLISFVWGGVLLWRHYCRLSS